MITAATDPTAPACECSDVDVQLLHELVEQGLDQAEVSHLLWGDPTRASYATTLAFTTQPHPAVGPPECNRPECGFIRLPRQENPQW